MSGPFRRSLVTVLLVPLMLLNLPPVLGSSGGGGDGDDNSYLAILEFEPVAAGGDDSGSRWIDSRLAVLKSMGYDFQVVDTLQNVMDGAVVRVSPDQLERLKGEPAVSKIHTEKFMKPHLDKSLKLISADGIVSLDSEGRRLTGDGIRIAVVDTGIDYTHKDLWGFGKGGKVVAGYDFLDNDDSPMDTDGHGTLIAGIIAADGKVKGVAPKAELVAYRVASEDSYVSTVDMIRALDRVVEDGVDIVNLSIGLDYLSEEIDRAVGNLVEQGIVVVAAVGNNGEIESSIGSPAAAPGAISVGASLNNVTSNLVSTLRIKDDKTRYDVIPMLGSLVTEEEPVRGRLVYANFATEEDVESLDLTGAIVLAERGGPLIRVDLHETRQIVYFSEKETNVAQNGAAALIVYNNLPGVFYGKLVHETNPLEYTPTLPVVSVSREEGLWIKELIDNNASGGGIDLAAELKVFYNTEPDVVAPFSSRGPVSPFYMKPDLIAPGAFINSTALDNSYIMTSGTSFAAPHVVGAAALLLQKDPGLQPEEVASILATTSDQVEDLYGAPYPYEIAGVGRLNVSSALESRTVAVPHYVILHLSSASAEASRTIELRSVGEEALGRFVLKMEWSDPEFGEVIALDASVEKNNDEGDGALTTTTTSLNIGARLLQPASAATGKFEGRLYVGEGSAGSEQRMISIPVIVYVDEVAVKATNEDGRIWLSVDLPDDWKFAKVKVRNPVHDGSHSVTLTPSNNLSSMPARTIGEHWIEADVVTNSGDAKGFAVLYVNETSTDDDGILTIYGDFALYGIPLREAFMIAAFLGIVAVVVFVWGRKRSGSTEREEPLSGGPADLYPSSCHRGTTLLISH